MRPLIRDLVSIAAGTLPIGEPIYEFGARQVPGQEGLADLRPLFPGRQYVGADAGEGPGVDRVLDLHALALPAHSAGTVICVDTLEHVEHPHRALGEIHRVLRPGGLTLIASVMDFPIHEYPHDYWRFTPEAFRSLLKPFAASFVGAAGREDFPHTVVGVGFKGAAPDLTAFAARYEAWRRLYRHATPRRPGLGGLVELMTPPLLHPALARIRRVWRRA